MGRIRTIKPEFFKHSGLYDLEKETSLPLRVAFAGLWTCCDREGRFKWRPRELKLDILPYDDCDFSRVLDALVTRGFIVKYESGREEFAFIPSWHTHQVINFKESASALPDPTKPKAVKPRVPHASTTRDVRKGKEEEGKGKEGEENIAPSLPDWISQETWNSFEQMRKRIKKPLTDEATKRILVRLEKWRGEGQDAEEILSMAIENNWQGLWPLEKKSGGGNGQNANGNGHRNGNSQTKGASIIEAARQAIQNMADREAGGSGDGTAGEPRLGDAGVLRGDVIGIRPRRPADSDQLFLPPAARNR